MKTTELKSDLHTLIDSTNDSAVLDLIYTILSKFKKSKNASVTLSVSEKKAVDKALESIKNGRVHRHEKVMAEMQKKYPSLIK